MVEDAFTAGLLHDSGKLALIANMPDLYAEALRASGNDCRLLPEVERRIWGATHPDVGAYLMGLWGLPAPIVEALAYHHTPAAYPGNGFGAVIAVHVADAFTYPPSTEAAGAVPFQIDLSYLSVQGFADRLPVWQELCRISEPE